MEYELILVAIHLTLQRVSAFRHILHNSNISEVTRLYSSESHTKLSVLLQSALWLCAVSVVAARALYRAAVLSHVATRAPTDSLASYFLLFAKLVTVSIAEVLVGMSVAISIACWKYRSQITRKYKGLLSPIGRVILAIIVPEFWYLTGVVLEPFEVSPVISTILGVAVLSMQWISLSLIYTFLDAHSVMENGISRPWEWRMNSAKRNALLAMVWISMINFGMRNAVLSDTEMWTLGYLS